MIVKKWEKLPQFMQVEEVRPYYEYLRKKKISLILKRLFDIFMSFLMIILLSPVLLFIALWIKCDSKGPVFYRQVRITQYGREFRIFKFRTMVVDADKTGSLVTVANDDRITKVGNKIRKVRLDELPQLFNIFLGDMTFVGTRPEVKKYVDAYSNEMLATLLLPTGVTSQASINYKDEDEILNRIEKDLVDKTYIEDILPEKMKYNYEYMNKFNLINDLKICFKTVFEVLK